MRRVATKIIILTQILTFLWFLRICGKASRKKGDRLTRTLLIFGCPVYLPCKSLINLSIRFLLLYTSGGYEGK